VLQTGRFYGCITQKGPKVAAKFWPILCRKGRKGVELLKNYFFSSYSNSVQIKEILKYYTFQSKLTQKTKFSSIQKPAVQSVHSTL
jgi:hypothetical protein